MTGGVAELGPEAGHCSPDRLAEGVGCLVPDAFEDLLGRHHDAGCGQENLQHGKLLGVERQGAASSGGDATRRIELQVAVGERRG